MKTIELVENSKTSGPRWVWKVWDGPYEVSYLYPYLSIRVPGEKTNE